MRSAEQYLAGLRDGREVYYRGERIADVVDHPELGLSARHGTIDFHGPGADPSPYYEIPRSADDLLARSALIEESTRVGRTLVVLIKEIGTDALLALSRVMHGTETEAAVTAYYERCRDGDLALAVAQTDAKGDRSSGPAEQADPDAYLRIVERRSDGIVVRGAKTHTSYAATADELIVIPTRSLAQGEEDWAVAFAVPIATPGVKLFCSDFLHGTDDPWAYPLSSGRKMIETLTVFDDVFVPWERVFLSGDVERAGRLALTFVEYHRMTAVSYKLPLLDTLVGLAIELAEANGIGRATHVRDKVTWLVGYSETVRALLHAACARAAIDPATAIAFPDPLLTNLAKWTFARDYYAAVERVIDIAGGLLVTGLSAADWSSASSRPYMEKYFAAAVPAEERLALINLASEVLARGYSGYQGVLAIHAEGSLEAEKTMVYRSYDAHRARNYARELAGVAVSDRDAA
jgi:4-hydroxybutyryl-CoA dehydratase/vinylacetyl-CoA-Delta-isomerase